MMLRRFACCFALAVLGAGFVAVPVRAEDAAPGSVGQPGLRIANGQSAVIGGNSAGARERALDEAFRQAVDQSLAEMLDAPTRAAQARALKALGARARTYVRRYRALEEGEVAGAYGVKLEVEVDEPALRRALERGSAPASSGRPSPATSVSPGLLLVGAGEPGASPRLVAALVTAGVRAELAEPAVTAAPAALAAASRAALPEVAFVTASSQSEGAVRGTTRLALSCRLAARVVAAPTGQAVAEHVAAPRAFADDEDTARAQCFTQAAAELAPRLSPKSTGAAPGGDLRTVTIDADVVEPAAVVALLRSVRAVGSVSSAELRRIVAGHIEIRARTRSLAAALAPALARDASAALSVSNVEVGADLIRLRARLRPSAAPSE